MPIEIRELVIKVTVQDDARPAASPEGAPAGLSPADLRRWQQELTQSCVRAVLAELRRRAER